MTSYEPVRAVIRAIRVLTVLNGFGQLSLTELSTRVGLSKPTVLRLLKTLVSEHLVAKDPVTSEYKVSYGARRLSWGYNDAHIMNRAAERAEAFTREHLWPCSVAAPERDVMRIHYSTHRKSPLTLWSPEVSQRLPLLDFALGLAYLGHCSREVQNSHLEFVDETRHRRAQPPIDREDLFRRLELVQERGYAFRGPTPENRTCSLAIPIMDASAPIAAMAVTYFSRTMTDKEARRVFLPVLRAAVSGGAEADQVAPVAASVVG